MSKLRPRLSSGHSGPSRQYQQDLQRRGRPVPREVERELAVRAAAGDRLARRQLVEANLGIVVKLAREFAPSGRVSVEDLVQEGNVALLEAAGRYDVARGVRFATYARAWVKAAFIHYVRRMGTALSLTMSADLGRRRAVFRARGAAARLAARGDDSSPEAVARELGCTSADVSAVLAAWRPPLPLHQTVYDGDAGGMTVADTIAADAPGPEETLCDIEARRRLRRVAGTLDARDRELLHRRHLAEEPTTQQVVAAEWGVSRQRVEQVERRALRKLFEAFEVAA